MSTRVHFQAEAWQRDYAIPVDAQGETEWTVDAQTAEAIAASVGDLDFVAEDSNAPEWIRHWQGPFTITLIEDQSA